MTTNNQYRKTGRMLWCLAIILSVAVFSGCRKRVGGNKAKDAEELEEQETEGKTIRLPGGVKLKMAKVEAGTFEMSAKDGENRSNEIPHQATLTKDFYIGRTEVTQAQWEAVMGNNPSVFKNNDLPVENVTWNDAMDFCEKLNAQGLAPEGWKFSLPTETQWEYAARGGNRSMGCNYSGSNDIDKVAWYQDNCGNKPHPAGRKQANELGLYDMSGNVEEWCLDDWNEDSSKQAAEFARGSDRSGSRRVFRGGSFFSEAKDCRSSYRFSGDLGIRNCSWGFRVALVPAEGYGSGSEAPQANAIQRKPSPGQTAGVSGGTAQQALPPEQRTISLPGNVKLELAKVEADSFEMSARDGENYDGEEVPHRATLTKDFYIGRTEVTQAQWKAMMGTTPSNFKGDDLPVENVSWNDAMEFCGKLNSTGKAPSGWKFTLPTETQWEFAARGGKKSKGYKYSGSNDVDEVAWYWDKPGSKTHAVGQKKANELGLYDMSGNVYEWCLDDWISDSSKLKAEFARGNDQGGSSLVCCRGGSWFNVAGNCRSAYRHFDDPGDRLIFVGFRVALVPESY